MANVILEGPDNTGKSWLANRLVELLGYTYQHSGGREKFPAEMIVRVERYLKSDRTVFDRHPCVSDPIYGEALPEFPRIPIPSDLMERFYEQKNFFVYCRPRGSTASLVGHTKSEETGDTEESLLLLRDRLPAISAAYDKWALKHASIIYRIGDNPLMVAGAVRSLLRG